MPKLFDTDNSAAEEDRREIPEFSTRNETYKFWTHAL